MKNTLIAEASVSVNATPLKVWEALTTPELIKKYLMGTTVSSEWKEGSAIEYNGEYEGRSYRDIGKIIKLEPEKTFQSTYFSSMSGKADKPENYKLVTYKISEEDNQTVVTVSQDNNENEQEKEHSTENWKTVLKKLKEVVEDEHDWA